MLKLLVPRITRFLPYLVSFTKSVCFWLVDLLQRLIWARSFIGLAVVVSISIHVVLLLILVAFWDNK